MQGCCGESWVLSHTVARAVLLVVAGVVSSLSPSLYCNFWICRFARCMCWLQHVFFRCRVEQIQGKLLISK